MHIVCGLVGGFVYGICTGSGMDILCLHLDGLGVCLILRARIVLRGVGIQVGV